MEESGNNMFNLHFIFFTAPVLQNMILEKRLVQSRSKALWDRLEQL